MLTFKFYFFLKSKLKIVDIPGTINYIKTRTFWKGILHEFAYTAHNNYFFRNLQK